LNAQTVDAWTQCSRVELQVDPSPLAARAGQHGRRLPDGQHIVVAKSAHRNAESSRIDPRPIPWRTDEKVAGRDIAEALEPHPDRQDRSRIDRDRGHGLRSGDRYRPPRARRRAGRYGDCRKQKNSDPK
jgi:hypothetical protein